MVCKMSTRYGFEDRFVFTQLIHFLVTCIYNKGITKFPINCVKTNLYSFNFCMIVFTVLDNVQ